MIIDDDTKQQPIRRKELKIEPISKDTPVAGVPVVQHDLEALQKKIDELNTPIVSSSAPNISTAMPEKAPEPKVHSSAAVRLIRNKLEKLYKKEPDVVDEAIESFQVKKRSKHQEYMYNLTNSGKSLAEIQTAWHTYYSQLPDGEKHEVWQEFYSAHEQQQHEYEQLRAAAEHHLPKHKHQAKFESGHKGTKTTAELKDHILETVSARGKLKAKHHIQSLLFGLGMGSIVVIIFLFGFFNERFIAPFMSPSRQVSATPIIGNSSAVGPEPKIVIPKINLEVPVVYDLNTTDEKKVQAGLENGVVHYSTSPTPGQTGNVVIVGHSSNNILNKGKYKFAFVLLKKLEVGDTFSLNKDGTRYTYQVFEKKIVKPDEVSVLGANQKANTATLITCDPPGTSINRLVVIGEQISPDVSGNKQVTQQTPELTSTGVLPSNAPSLWQRIKEWF